MAFFRVLAATLLAAALAAAGGGGAFADPPPWAHHHSKLRAEDPPPRSHAVVSGTVVGVDYGTASLLVATPRGIVPVAVTPTTSIFRGPEFASLGDLGRGARVSIDVSEVDGRLIAQIIRILH